MLLILVSGHVFAHRSENHIDESRQKKPIDYSRIAVRKDIKLHLVQPYENVILGEGPNYYLGIKNESKKDLLVNLIGDLNQHELSYAGAQMLVESRKREQGENLTKPEFIPDWNDLQPRFVSDEFGLVKIRAGESAIFGSKLSLPYDLQFNYGIFPAGAEEFRIGMLVGPNEWAFSNWTHTLKPLNINRRVAGDVVLKLNVSRLEEWPIKRINIEGTNYLFALGTRVCIIPEGIDPELEQHGKGLETKLVVKFPGTKFEPVVHHFNSMTTLSGPRELVPHLDALKELKTKLEPGGSINSVRSAHSVDTP